MKSTLRISSLLLLLIILGNSFVHGQFWSELDKLQASDREGDDNHGYSVSISGNYAIVGAWHEDHDTAGANTLSNAGAAYIYENSGGTWTQVQKIVANDRSLNAEFGYSVGIDGDYAVIGSVRDSASSGAAYVFERNGSGVWVQVAKLVASERRANDRFGVSVAISGSTIIVGAHHEDEDASDMNTLQNAGSAYFYTRSGGVWSFSQKIAADTRDVNDEFGISVGIDGSFAIIGAYRYDQVSAETGAAYVFFNNGSSWVERTVLTAADGMGDDEFGWAVDVSGINFIVGAWGQETDTAGGNSSINAGAVYFFSDTATWTGQKMVHTDRDDQDNLGYQVSISGDIAIASAHLQNYDTAGGNFLSDAGAAYIFKKNGSTWNQHQKLVSGDRFTSDKFGFDVDIDATTIIVGAPEDNDNTIPSSGAAYIFTENTTGLNEEEMVVASVYPNPSYDQLMIDLHKVYPLVNINVVSIEGKIMLRQKLTDANMYTLNIHDFPAGTYLVKITAGKQSQVLRIVKTDR